MRLLLALAGYRDDLNLQGYWWHRLFKVLGVLTLLLVGGIAGIVRYENERYEPLEFTVDKGLTLHDHMLRMHGRGITAGYVSTFYEEPGSSGLLDGGRLRWRYLEPDACWIATLVKEADGTPVDPPKPLTFCSGKPDFEPHQVMKFERKAWAPVVYAAPALLVATAWMLLVAAVGMTVYYRGVIYVVKGPRAPAQA